VLSFSVQSSPVLPGLRCTLVLSYCGHQEVADLTNGNAAQRRKNKREQKRLDSAPETQEPPERHNGPDKKDELGKKKGNQTNMCEKIFGSAAFWTAVFTGVLTLFTGLLYMVSNRANEVNVATQRATVNISGPVWAKIQSPDGKSIAGWRFLFSWGNSGRTPANNAVYQTNLYIGDVRPEKGLDFGTLPQSPTLSFVLGPNATYGVQNMDISIEQLKEVADGKKHMFFWGWIAYDDGIPHTPRRLTEYCMDVTSLSFSKPNDLTNPTDELIANWPPCKTHYCYDDQCGDYTAHTK